MKTASLKEIKAEIETIPLETLQSLCLKLVKFKKENKELLTYLMFEEGNEPSYVNSIKEVINDLFETVNKSQLYFAKKTIRKIIRVANKYIKYSSCKTTEPDILIHICEKINDLNLDLSRNAALNNLYLSQIKKIKKSVATMHEDEQYDYLKMIEIL
jgi:hypothetical protein